MTQATFDAETLQKQGPGIVPVIPADTLKLYQARAARLNEKKGDADLADYLALIEQLVSVQATVAEKGEFGPMPAFKPGEATPFAADKFRDDKCWQMVLLEIISGLLPVVPENVAAILKMLAETGQDTLQGWAYALRSGKFSDVPAEYSLFIWAALSSYWAHWAPKAVPALAVDAMENRQLCPVCGSHPVASVIKEEPREGLRYLHCSLCETEWHMVRATCTNCYGDDEVYLWAEQEKEAPVRIESCGHCHGYTKMLFTNLDPKLDPAVDDLLTMHYDQHLAEKGFKPTTVNPYLLAHEE